MDILGIGYLGFESANYKEWIDYGTEVLGFGLMEPREGDDETVYLRMDDRAWRIAIHPGEVDHLSYIGWEIKDRPSLHAAIATLEAAGVEVERGDAELAKKRSVKEVVRFKDPGGYQHELFYAQQYELHSFVPGRPHYGFVAEENGVGHIVLNVPEYTDELDDFWTNVMGFRWFGQGAAPMGRFGFYAAPLNEESHNIAFALNPGKRGIHHIGILCQKLEDVGIAYDRTQERDVDLIMTLGQHTQDPVISFYTTTPSDWAIEYLTVVGEYAPFEVLPQSLSIWGHKMVGNMMVPSVRPVDE
jgi:2,3-dihydroxybiphenyl 1,2-dioxygenase